MCIQTLPIRAIFIVKILKLTNKKTTHQYTTVNRTHLKKLIISYNYTNFRHLYLKLQIEGYIKLKCYY